MYHCQMVDDPISLLLMPIIIGSVLSGLSFSLLDSTQNMISVRQSLKVETDYCAFHCESDL